MAEPNIPPGFDFTDPDLYAERVPDPEFAELRRTAPVWWNPQPQRVGGFGDGGYWVLTRHADIVAVSKDSETYSTWENTAIIRHQDDATRDQIELQRFVMLNIDPPQHTKLRGIVSRGFTPRAISSLRETLTARAEQIAATALARGSGDFVTEVARELPLQAIAELLGVPQEDRRKVFDWSNALVGYDDPDYGAGPAAEGVRDGGRGGRRHTVFGRAAELIGYSMAMAEDRRRCPRDDIVTKLVHAEVDGGQLSPDEFGFFVILLAVAGNETTRNAISNGMLAFFAHPDQWELFRAERSVPAADEIIRWATPITVFQRTALAETTLGGLQIRAGQRLGLFYRSANFDEEVFDHPERFDIRRSPNPHLGFGGSGVHYCLGASLARLEIELIFTAIADAMPGIRLAGDPVRLRSGWLNGIKRMPVQFTSSAPRG